MKWGTASLVLTLSTTSIWMVSFMLRLIYHRGKSHRCPLTREGWVGPGAGMGALKKRKFCFLLPENGNRFLCDRQWQSFSHIPHCCPITTCLILTVSFIDISVHQPLIFCLFRRSVWMWTLRYFWWKESYLLSSTAAELSGLHLVAEVDVPGRAPVQPCNDVYTHFVTDGELCDWILVEQTTELLTFENFGSRREWTCYYRMTSYAA